LRFFLATQVIRQVHHFFDLFLAVLTIAIVQLLLLLLRHDNGSRLRLSMVTRGRSWNDRRLFLYYSFWLLGLKLLNWGLKDLLRGDRVSLLYDFLALFLSLLSLSWELGGGSGPHSLLLLS
jgi:hypothetical protein